MNLIDLRVVKVLSEPKQYKDTNIYTTKVLAEAYGSVQETHVYSNSKEEAYSIDVGYIFEG